MGRQILSTIQTVGIYLTSFSHMTTGKTYKKHMKHASDLFWIAPNGSGDVYHWQFDRSYHQTEVAVFQSDDPQEAINDVFVRRTNEEPQDGSTTDSEMVETVPQISFRRAFLTFPPGFCSEIRRTESRCRQISPGPFF
jgi:hypothetical protein